ncbi:MAG: hypothetical protein IPK33_12245 [Gemmatimonadetes bacterium]|jgi:hypothetical protein|nr:hypothetical protein [Gemmatimonadota bacterium]MBK6845698.1 hypothetical protein [Gemmatimonadota bacterium]MBK7832824.1 hypothetical protein [Gemmatimonadota bacterium]MBK8058596.1 hypothetical protein [Gemmatimonadota bacterium]MBK8650029.1 hypothetical protein [Gemmatimonadota bacterium]
MVITLFADRRTLDIADIAGRLALALAPRVPSPGVVVATPRALAQQLSDDVSRVIIADGGRPAEVTQALQQLVTQYPVILVAWSGAPDEQMLAACDASDRVLIVSDPSVASLRATQRALKLCTSLGYGIDKVSVVLHGFADDAPLAPGEAAGVLRREIFWVLPGGGAAGEVRRSSYAGLAERLSART